MMEKYIHHFFEKDTETGQRDKRQTGQIGKSSFLLFCKNVSIFENMVFIQNLKLEKLYFHKNNIY